MAKIQIPSASKDMSPDITSAWNAAHPGDTIQLIPTNGMEHYLFEPLVLLGTKTVHWEATGATLYRKYAGTQPAITLGAPLGSRVEYIRWTGGNIIDGMCLQNAANASIDLDILGGYPGSTGLQLTGDVGCFYLKFKGNIVANGGHGITVNPLSAGAWFNKLTFSHTAINNLARPNAVLNYAIPASATWAPPRLGLWVFDDCCFESGTPVDLFAGNPCVNFMFNSCWFEVGNQDFILGKYDPLSLIQFHNCGGGVNWYNPAVQISNWNV